MTGILTETANLTNSYQYDPYGNLTSGTADGVNYYGYNGESTNVKTGLQYLRARYYNAENGTFTTEDSDLGTTKNPLTRNRYAYTSNNPVNYDDPTGHSWWKKAVSAVKNVGKKIVNTATQPSVYSVIGKKGIRRATIIKDYVNTITTRQDRTPAQVIDLGGGKYRYLTEQIMLLSMIKSMQKLTVLQMLKNRSSKKSEVCVIKIMFRCCIKCMFSTRQ